MAARLQQTTSRKMIRALQRLGFVIVKTKGSHMILNRNGTETCVPYHSSELPRWLMMEIIKQAGLAIEDIRPYL